VKVEQENQIARISAALRRRRLQSVITLVSGVVVAGLLALLLPATYRSLATVYVEPPDVTAEGMEQEDLPEQQIARVSQRVLTTTNLADVVRRLGLYDGSGLPLTERVERLKENFGLETVTAMSTDSRGRPTETVVTFTMHFDHPDPSTAQRVLNALVTLYSEENADIRNNRVLERLNFLQSEAADVAQDIQGLETQLAAFLARNVGVTPGAQQSTIQLLQRAESERLETDRNLRTVEDRIIYLRAEIAQLEGSANTRGAALLPQDQLLVAQADLRALQARYGENHPDVVAARRAVSALETALEQQKDVGDPAIAGLRAELTTASERYTDNHPEVMRLKREIEELEQAVTDQPATQSSNPALVSLQADLASALAEERSLGVLRDQQSQRVAALEGALSKLPEVEIGYREITADLEYLRAQYQALKEQELDAGVALAVEEQRRGQKFVVIEEPSLPQQPIKPNRLAVLFVGIVLSLALVVFVVAVLEALDLRIHGRAGVLDVLGVPPIATIPVIGASGGGGNAGITTASGGVGLRRLGLIGLGVLLALLLGLVIVHTQVAELPTLWLRLFGSV
jgi:succinoglycan biosynthesis transport protein ExoP